VGLPDLIGTLQFTKAKLNMQDLISQCQQQCQDATVEEEAEYEREVAPEEEP
jgi:hypothetical protein